MFTARLRSDIGIFGHKMQKIRESQGLRPFPDISRPIKRKGFGGRLFQTPIYRVSTISRMQHRLWPDRRSPALRNTSNLSTGLCEPPNQLVRRSSYRKGPLLSYMLPVVSKSPAWRLQRVHSRLCEETSVSQA